MKNMQIVISASLLTLLLLRGCAANQVNETASHSVSNNNMESNMPDKPGDGEAPQEGGGNPGEQLIELLQSKISS